jgi:amino acid adenylation domain-containing protein
MTVYAKADKAWPRAHPYTPGDGLAPAARRAVPAGARRHQRAVDQRAVPHDRVGRGDPAGPVARRPHRDRLDLQQNEWTQQWKPEPGRQRRITQQRLWFLDQIQPGRTDHMATALRITGAFDADRFADAVSAVVERHEALRTRIEPGLDGPIQIVEPASAVVPELADFTDRAPEQAWRRAEDRVAAAILAPFDLCVGPLLRVVLLRVAANVHIVVIVVHHIVCDGWSMPLLWSSLVSAYRGASLPELPVQFGDFALWQRARPHEDIDYWRGQLAGLPPLELPLDRMRPADRSGIGSVARFTIPAHVRDGLREVGRSTGATMFMTALAGFRALLSRWCGQDDFVVGSPIAGRRRPEVESLIGFFVDTLVLRADVSGDPSFAELLERVRDSAVAAYTHQEVPFERLIDEVGGARALGRNPLSDVIFQLREGEDTPPALPDAIAELLSMDREAATFDLSVILVEGPDGLTGKASFATDILDTATVARLTHQFVRLLTAATACPQTSVARLPLQGPAERAQLLDTGNDVPLGRPVHKLFQEFAQSSDTAVIFGSETLTYAELDNRSNRLGHFLVKQGVGRGSVVGLLVERGLDMVLAILAVLKTGAAYVPIDVGYPAERIEFMVSDSGTRLVVTNAMVAEACSAGPALPLDVQVTGADLAYVIHTSGSTGQPKGAMIHHAGLSSLTVDIGERLELRHGDVVAALTTMSFDIVLELPVPLTAGAAIMIGTREMARDGALLADVIERTGVTVVQGTPASWQILLDSNWSAPRVKAVRGGEVLPVDLATKILSRVGRLWNGYGPSETTVYTTMYEVLRDVEGVSVPIGRPVASTRTLILDAGLKLVPDGVLGELYVAGAQVGHGYLNRAGLTATRFIADPYGTPDTRLYRTGDLARWTNSCEIDYVGRIDDQVKLRGYRIELGEIEATITSHPEVSQAVAVVREDQPGHRMLVVYHRGGDVNPTELRDLTAQRLPEFMIPAVFQRLSEFPYTPSGKVDRRALPVPIGGRVHRTYAAPRSASERILLRIWHQVLDVDEFGIHDDYFELGGDSILSIQIVAHARAAGPSLTVRQMFTHRTIAALAEDIDGGQTVAPLTDQRPVAGPVTLTPILHWFTEQPFLRHDHFNQSVLLDCALPHQRHQRLPEHRRLDRSVPDSGRILRAALSPPVTMLRAVP